MPTEENDYAADDARVLQGQRESLPKWLEAAAALLNLGYGLDSVARPGGYTARQCLAHANACVLALDTAAAQAGSPVDARA